MKFRLSETILVIVILSISLAFGLKAWHNGFTIFTMNLDANFNSALGSFFSGTLGVAVSGYAVILVSRTYNLQKLELDETRKLLASQVYDQTFFNLVNSLNFILTNMKHVDLKHYISVTKGPVTDRKEYDGYDFLKFFHTLFYEFYRDLKRVENGQSLSPNMKDNYKRILNLDYEQIQSISAQLKSYSGEKELIFVYMICYEAHQNILSSYFLTVYQILKHIEQLDLEDNAKRRDRYVSIFQARLNSLEKSLLFYNGLAFPKARQLLDSLFVLKNLSIEDLLDPAHASLYRDIVYSRDAHLKEMLAE